MSVLIVENSPQLGLIWQRHIQRQGHHCHLAFSQAEALECFERYNCAVMILNLALREGSVMAVSDYVAFRAPETKVILVSGKGFFSDGSVFSVIANACAMVGARTPPNDMAALVDYHTEIA
ncbi:MAG: response regulator [Litoreibacter sp.]